MQDIDRQGSKNVLVMHSFFWLGSVAILAGSFFGAVPWIDSNRLPASMFPPPAELPLGAEYFQIGKAISEGRGFSSPFRVPSGPTAWMPPAIPVLLSGLFLATNRNEFWTAILFHGIGTVCVLGCWFSILRFATKAGVPLAPTTFAFVMCLYSQ